VVERDVKKSLALVSGAWGNGARVDVLLDHEVFVAGVYLWAFGIGVHGLEADTEFADVVEVFGLSAAFD
jgi:hypothetical protein